MLSDICYYLKEGMHLEYDRKSIAKVMSDTDNLATTMDTRAEAKEIVEIGNKCELSAKSDSNSWTCTYSFTLTFPM